MEDQILRLGNDMQKLIYRTTESLLKERALGAYDTVGRVENTLDSPQLLLRPVLANVLSIETIEGHELHRK